MQPSSQGIPLTMIRGNMEALPVYALPEGFRIDWYQQGDEEHWIRIHREADIFNDVNIEVYRRYFGFDSLMLSERQCFLLDLRGHKVGTVSAWFDDNFQGRSYGRLHWLAIIPRMQGKGLSRPLLSVACTRLRDLGHENCYLRTSSMRLRAIKVLLQFGFYPYEEDQVEQQAWKSVLASIEATSKTNQPLSKC